MIFQRFDDRMLGLSNSTANMVSEGVLKPDQQQLMLEGRRTFTGYVLQEVPANSSIPGSHGSMPRYRALCPPVLVNSSTLSHTAFDSSLFFKSAWPEDVRVKEPTIIAEALARAKKYLPEKHVSSVADHLPRVVDSKELKHTSTAIIRHLLRLSTEGARTQVWMVSEKLQPIVKVNAAMFKKYYWELVRCMCFC